MKRQTKRQFLRALWIRTSSVLIVSCTVAVAASAEPPTLNHLYPAGAELGSSVTVTLSGKFEPWPPTFWVDAPGLSINTDTNKGKLYVQVGARATPGPRLLRLVNDEGASEPRMFIIGPGREIGDSEPNNHFAKPQTLPSLPLTINGRLDKNGDVDSFSIPLRAGQWIDARLDAYTLMSKLDAVLRLVDTNGTQLVWNHDWSTLDPRLVWRTSKDQTVVLQVFGFPYPANAEIQLDGGEAAVYRLHLSADVNLPPDLCQPLSEKASNKTCAEAQPLEIPADVMGTIGGAQDEDRFSFAAKKDQIVEAAVDAASFGSPLDAWLKIEDASGKEITRNDDVGASRDPRLEWKAPSDGTFILALGSVTHRGGDDFRYRLVLRTLEPDFEASVEKSSFVLNVGTTNEVKIKFSRLRGCTNALSTAFHNLPEGVFASIPPMPETNGDVTISLVAGPDAPGFNGAVQLVISDSTAQKQRPVSTYLTSRSVDNGVPGGYSRLLVESTDQLWLTVRNKPTEPPTSGEKK